MKVYHIAVNREGTFINLGKPKATQHTYFVNRAWECYVYWIGRDIPSVEEQIETHDAISNWIDGKDILQ